MNLIYRGLTYNRNPHKTYSRSFQPIIRSQAAYNLTYRGVSYRVNPDAKPTKVSVKPITRELTYRGVSYFVNRTVFVQEPLGDDG